MAAILHQIPHELQVYQQPSEGSGKVDSVADGVLLSKDQGRSDMGHSRAAWLEAVEDKENVDPASGLTVTTRRQRRRLVATPAQNLTVETVETPAGQASKGPRQPLKDITPAFPEAIVRPLDVL